MTMIKNRPWLQRTKKWALGLLASAALVSSASAQADVTRIDIRLLPFGEDALMVQLRPNNTWTRADGLFNVSFTVRWLTSEGGSLGEPDQIENLPNTCMVVGASLGENPLGEVDHETFRYQNYTATSGTQFPTSCSFAANTWVDFAVLPVTLGAGDCGTFEIVRNVPEGAGSNLSFYIGLGGVEFTPVSTIESTTVQLGSCPPSCIAPTNVVATNNSGTVCSTGSLNLSSSFTGTSDGATFLWTGPAGVSFSPNNTSQNVTVNSPASGTYTVTVTNACGNASGNVSATVTAAPSATISYGSPLCASSTSATVTRTGTAGGTYTAPAAVSINASTGTINPSLSTPGGPYTITYTVAASGGCAAFSTTATVNITAAPSATISYASPLCSSSTSATVTRTGTAGGSYTAPAAVSINASTGAINPSLSTPGGPYTITYTVAAAGGCAAFSTTATVNITAAPSATISYASPLCASSTSATVTRTGTAGGTYTAPAAVSINAGTGTINPSLSTIGGPYTITYTVAAANGCAAFSTTASVTISAAPSATISYGSPLCSSSTSATVTRTGTSGGTYTAPAAVSINASTGTINPSLSTVGGPYTITYTVAPSGDCAGFSTTASVTITAAPSATISYAGSPYCSTVGSSAVTRTGTSGGTYSSTTGLTLDANTGAIDPSTSTAGTYTVTYTIAASGGCAAFSTTATVTITAAPTATISYTSPVCSNGSSAAVTRTGTAGGTYTAPAAVSINASTGEINVASSTPGGPYTITYTVAASGGCAAFSTTASITITAAPAASISYSGSPFCTAAVGTVSVTRTGTSGGSYSSTAGLTINASTGAITPSSSAAGTYTVTYTVAASGGCAAFSTTASVTIDQATTWYADADGDGFGDPAVSQQACTQPVGHVSNNSDSCPLVEGIVGSSCDDEDPLTTGDALNAQCECVGSLVDCDDEDPCTSDSFNGVACVNTPLPDSDTDGTCDLIDGCPNDPNKIAPGVCGCGTADVDSDTDGTLDCNDGCPNDPNKTAPGACGCGVADVATTYYADTDGDGFGDPASSEAGFTCSVPQGFVANNTDNCPTTFGRIGDACDDLDAETINDVIGQDCVCRGTDMPEVDCEGVPNGPAMPGTACDDEDATTYDDVYAVDCECVGTPYDCPVLLANIGDACDDLDQMTQDDTINANCECVGTPIVVYDCPELEANIGDACDDDNAMTEDDTINGNCVCVGTPIVVYECPELEANIGDACDDDNAMTEDDTVNAQCECVGTPIIVWDCPVLEANIGDACNDNDATTEDDMVNAQCVCAGTSIYDCPTLQANIGDACDDGVVGTVDDVVNANCVCAGVPTGCTENLNLAITLDAFGSQTTWQLVNDASTVVASGGPYNNGAAGTVVNAPICVPQGCYHLRVSDSNGNGITNGGYVLTDASNRRIIDASKGSFSTNSEILLGGAPMNVCVPLSNNGMLAGTCDLPSRRINLPVYASSGGPNATQYQFWIFDPHGTYSRRLVTASPQFTPGDQQTNPIPLNKDLNICVRVMIGGEYRPFGPVCRYRFVPATSTPGAPSSLMLDGLSADLYPNPNRTGVVNLNLQGLSKSGLPVAIDIYDALGKVVYNEQVPGTESTFNHVLDLSGDLRAGMYLVNITVDGQRLTKRLILE